MKHNIPIAFIAILIVLTSLGCKKEGAPAPTPIKKVPRGTITNPPGYYEVLIQKSSFSPSSLYVPLNSTVLWINKSGTYHTLHGNSYMPPTTIYNGMTYRIKFTTITDFAYGCTLHPNEMGGIHVQ